jgi:hypothetical protein
MPGAPTMVLRLSLPAGEDFRAIAVDLARKVADYVGCPAPDGAKVVASLESLAAAVAPNGSASGDIEFEFHKVGGELKIEARCAGRTSVARHPLSAAT